MVYPKIVDQKAGGCYIVFPGKNKEVNGWEYLWTSDMGSTPVTEHRAASKDRS